MENTPSVSSPPPSSSFLPVSPPLFPKPSHTHTHTHTTVLPFPFSPLIHPPVWFCGTDAGSAEEKYRGVKHVCSPMKRAERTGRKCEMTLKINVSLGERETLRGPKIAGQTKAWINQSFSFLPSSSFFPLHFFFFFFERKPLSSLTYTATPRLLGYDTCGCHPQTEGASFFFFFFFFASAKRQPSFLFSFFSSIIWNLKEQKWKHMHCQLGEHQAQYEGDVLQINLYKDGLVFQMCHGNRDDS